MDPTRNDTRDESSGHDRFVEFAWLALDGELTPAEQQELDRHLPECAACRERVAASRKIQDALRADAPPNAPASLMNRADSELVHAAGSATPLIPWRRWIAAAAALLVVAVVWRTSLEWRERTVAEKGEVALDAAPEATAAPGLLAEGSANDDLPKPGSLAVTGSAESADAAGWREPPLAELDSIEGDRLVRQVVAAESEKAALDLLASRVDYGRAEGLRDRGVDADERKDVHKDGAEKRVDEATRGAAVRWLEVGRDSVAFAQWRASHAGGAEAGDLLVIDVDESDLAALQSGCVAAGEHSREARPEEFLPAPLLGGFAKHAKKEMDDKATDALKSKSARGLPPSAPTPATPALPGASAAAPQEKAPARVRLVIRRITPPAGH